MSTGFVLSLTALILFLYESGWTLFAIRSKRADVADVAWGIGFVCVAWVSFLLSEQTLYGALLNLPVTIWGLRLSFHIRRRNRSRQEDFRYQELKKGWGDNVRLALFLKVFLLQGLLLYLISLPIFWVQTHPSDLHWGALWTALPIWLVGFCIESIADRQLELFKQNQSNRGKLLMKGLWSYSRHPNYLGEIIQWWALWIPAAFLPWGWTLVFSPLLITYLIIFVSGIAPLEKKMKNHPDFLVYSRKTASLIPFIF
jgi:steroid 5-alpha reductase family enzyme